MINVGLIGYGLSGKVLHAPLILAAGMRIAAVVTSRGAEVTLALPEAQVYANEEQLLERDDIDLIVVATPNTLHLPQALAALRSGKHVVVDKPLCITAAEADELARVARQADRRLAVFHNRRWDSDFLTIRNLIDTGRLGEVVAFQARWDRYRPVVADRWRERAQPGSGLFYDLGSHLIDQALCLFGRPDWIQADVFAQRGGARSDDGFELLMGKGRLRVTLGASSLAADDRFRYRVLGDQASFIKQGRDPQEAQLRAGIDPRSAGFGDEPAGDYGVLTTGADAARVVVKSVTGRWLTFYEAMRRSTEDAAAVPVSATDARLVLAVIEAAMLSSHEGRRVTLD